MRARRLAPAVLALAAPLLAAAFAVRAAAAQTPTDTGHPAVAQPPAPAPDTAARPRAQAGTTGLAPAWQLLVGHSYSSARALTQPATFTVEQERGQPLYTVLDAAATLRGALADRAWLEMGLRARGGSARPPGERAYGAMVRMFGELDPVLVAAGYEYLADGHFVVQQPAATFEVTALGGAPGLGTWVSPALHLRWRPWLGVSWGKGVRPYLRVDGEWTGGRFEAGLETTGWIVDGAAVGFVQGDVSVRLVGGLFATASGEAGRAPPTFEPEGRFGIGLGFRLGPT